MTLRAYSYLLLGALLCVKPIFADEDTDLDQIPVGARQPASDATPPAPSGANQRVYVENAFILSGQRGALIVPSPQPAASAWQERLFLDVRKAWSLGDRLNLTLSDRFNLRAEDDLRTPTTRTQSNDFREGYLSWEPPDRTYLDVGRINLKSGVALGYNPTDFFKTRAVVEPLSADPSVLREDRLGTLMLRTQHIWQSGYITAVLAPALCRPSPIYTNTNLPSFNPSFDRTNAHDRLLVKGSANIGSDFSPELLFYHEGNHTKLGANISRSFGQGIVGYAEWAGGDQASLIDDALRYGRETGALPSNPPSPRPDNPRSHFRSDLSIGGSYSTQTKITLQPRISFSPGWILTEGLEQLVHSGPGDHEFFTGCPGALVQMRPCARPAGATNQALDIPARRLGRHLFRAFGDHRLHKHRSLGRLGPRCRSRRLSCLERLDDRCAGRRQS